MHSSLSRRLGISIGAFLMLALLALAPAPAAAEPLRVASVAAVDAELPPVTMGALTTNCGIVTCSTYISRSGTRALYNKLNDEWGWWGTETAVCLKAGTVPVVGVPLGVYCGVRFKQFNDTLKNAGESNRCFKVTYAIPSGNITHISPSNGKFCKN